jgi:hypothetical protein
MPQSVQKKERRRNSRSPLNKMAVLLWDDEDGHESLLQAKLIDISVTGAKVWLPIRLPARTLVAFSCPSMALGGRGTVRYCNAAKGGYQLGLELSNGTGWSDQNTDLQHLAAGLDRSDQIAVQEAPPPQTPGTNCCTSQETGAVQ